ncbi:MAG: contact-dependent growth inhibition system immunity protein [Nocardioides sp.]
MQRYSAVSHLLSCYLYQDWDEDFSSWQEAVDAFTQDEPGMAAALPGELAAAMAERPRAEDLDAFYDTLGGAYDPYAHDSDIRTFLEAVSRRVRERVSPPPGGPA